MRLMILWVGFRIVSWGQSETLNRFSLQVVYAVRCFKSGRNFPDSGLRCFNSEFGFVRAFSTWGRFPKLSLVGCGFRPPFWFRFGGVIELFTRILFFGVD